VRNLFEQIDKLQTEINQHRPLDAYLRKQIKDYYRIGLTYSSNALEGNTLTESETKIVIEEGITIGGKPLKDHCEAIGHSEAFDFIFQLAGRNDITEGEIKKIHKIFYGHVDLKQAGKYRKRKAFITGSKYPLPLPENISSLMHEFAQNLINWRKEKHPVEFSAIAHKELVFIHPFIDGNGRVSRLLMNLILLQGGYNITIIPPVLRQEYIQSLEIAHYNDKPFIELIARAVIETQRDYLRLFV
jgi:Fic family protein